MDTHTPRIPALTHDGWADATLYHFMVAEARRARWVVVLPQHRMPDGDTIPMYQRGYDETMWPLVDARPTMRVLGFVGLCIGANKVARTRIAAMGEDGE